LYRYSVGERALGGAVQAESSVTHTLKAAWFTTLESRLVSTLERRLPGFTPERRLPGFNAWKGAWFQPLNL
jgi:hypothetical protein